MASLRANEGYILVDHRNSPGIPKELEDFWIASGKLQPGEVVQGGTMHESGLQTCSHCQRVLIMNPLRQRDRATCLKCYHYICDWCATSTDCHNIYKVLDDLQEATAKAGNLVEL